MKKSIIFLLTFNLFSCGVSPLKNAVNKPLFEILTQQNDGGANIRFFEILTEPNEIKMLQNDPKLKNKISADAIQTSNFIVLNLGEKSTSGFKIGIESILETDKNILITVKEISPEPGSITSPVFVNPYCIVKVNSKKGIIIK
jgi:hypothetical protein